MGVPLNDPEYFTPKQELSELSPDSVSQAVS